jgi:hypothetical protein
MLNEPETALPVGQSFTPKQLRILKASVIIMGVLLVLGFGLLLIGLYLQATKVGKPQIATPPSVSVPLSGVAAPASRPAVSIAIEPGAELHETFADQGRLILHLKRNGESEFAVIDLATGRETQRILIAPKH